MWVKSLAYITRYLNALLMWSHVYCSLEVCLHAKDQLKVTRKLGDKVVRLENLAKGPLATCEVNMPV